MRDEELLRLNQEGFIPGPDEDEAAFLRRVAEAQARLREGDWIPSAHLDWVRVHLGEVFGFSPERLPAFYSNSGLTPWQGAASWIEGGKLVSIQLREALRKGAYLGYERDEILAHEAVHAARSGFDEQVGEEFFAYMVSEKWWRKAFGPIVRRPWEVWPLLGLMVAGMFFPWMNGLAAIWIGLGALRLVATQQRMRRGGKRVVEVLGDVRRARWVMFRLTDEEIWRFARGEDVAEYAKRQGCLRWRLIRLAYFPKSD